MTAQKTTCLACGTPDHDRLPEYPPLCNGCLARAGTGLKFDGRVICTIDNGCSGILDRYDRHGLYGIVITDDGAEAWIPICELVAVVQ